MTYVWKINAEVDYVYSHLFSSLSWDPWYATWTNHSRACRTSFSLQ